MTRAEAIYTIYELINSHILDEELEEELIEICNCIEENNFEEAE